MHAHEHDRELAATILDQMLTIVDDADGAGPGTDVLQTFAILGTRFLECGDHELASLVQVFLQRVPAATLERVRDRILAVKDWRFWEITERGEDFNYLQPSSKVHFQEFLAAVTSSEATS